MAPAIPVTAPTTAMKAPSNPVADMVPSDRRFWVTAEVKHTATVPTLDCLGLDLLGSVRSGLGLFRHGGVLLSFLKRPAQEENPNRDPIA